MSSSDHTGSIAAPSLLKTPSAGGGLGTDHPVRRLAELMAVTAAALGTVCWLHAQQITDHQWLLIPIVLALAALLPSWLRGRDFPRMGWDIPSIRPTLIRVGWVCACTFPFMVAGLWSIRSLHLPLPPAPLIRSRSDGFGWLLYQFLYVAVAEEVFFRGYVQTGVAQLCRRTLWSPFARTAATIFVSAACFALAHAVVQEHAIALLTFFPGLVMAWLFLRTGSLLAPVLFHGLANTAYAIAAAVLS
jgi:membrane protease YdiL (CAAX protease family)